MLAAGLVSPAAARIVVQRASPSGMAPPRKVTPVTIGSDVPWGRHRDMSFFWGSPTGSTGSGVLLARHVRRGFGPSR